MDLSCKEQLSRLRFGCAYYREYMPYERIDEDIKLMQKAHINYVRIAESTWSTFEKDDGMFDFSSVLTVLDKMHAAGIGVIVGTPTYAVPAWLARKYPEILVKTPAGRQRYGRRQIMDISHPAFLYYADRIIHKLLQAVHAHPAVIGYQLDNETKYYDCVSDNVQIAFVKHLKQAFNGDLEALNRAFGLDYWSNRIDSWEDFPDVVDTINGSLYCAFKKFQRSLVTDYLKHQESLVRPYLKEGQFITHNFDFEWRDHSFGLQPDVDHFKASQCLDVPGVDIYHPSQEFLTGAEIAFGGDECRCLKDSRYLVLETQAQAFRNWTPFPGQLYLQAMAHVASGASLLGYWHWHSIHNSFETYWKGLLSHDFLENPVFNEAVQIGADFEKLDPVLKGYHKKNKICLVVSNEALSAIDVFPYHGPSLNTVKFPHHLYNDVLRRYYDALYESNLECDIRCLDDDRIFEYELLVLPLIYCISDERLERLRTFVKQGGHVLFSFKSAVADEHVKVRAELQPGRLADLLGVSYQLIAEPHEVKLRPQAADFAGCELLTEDFMELLTVNSPDVKVLASYDHQYYQSYAAITTRRLPPSECISGAAGSASYIGAHVSKSAIKAVLEFLVQEYALAPERSSLRFPLIVRSGINAAGEGIEFVLNFSNKSQSFACPWNAADVLSGRGYQQGDTVSLKDWGVAVLKLSVS